MGAEALDVGQTSKCSRDSVWTLEYKHQYTLGYSYTAVGIAHTSNIHARTINPRERSLNLRRLVAGDNITVQVMACRHSHGTTRAALVFRPERINGIQTSTRQLPLRSCFHNGVYHIQQRKLIELRDRVVKEYRQVLL